MDGGATVRAAIEGDGAALNAFVEVLPQEKLSNGPLLGLTVGIKDCFYDRGRAPTMGSRVHPPALDETATILERSRAAGADVVGYTNLHEWAIGGTSTVTATGPVRNPWALDLIAGGSSGGSAAALAAGLVDLAVGTDTGGSIRIPAACCGVVGLKPTQDRIPTEGYIGRGGPTDQIGPMGRDVAAVRSLFACLIDEPVVDEEIGSFRIGIASGPPFDNIAPEVAAPYERALETVRTLGASRAVTFPDWDAQWWANSALFINHTATLVAEDIRQRPGDFHPDALKVLRWGLSVPADVLEDQRRAQDEVRSRWAAMFEDIDVLISPTLPSLPPPIHDLRIRLPLDKAHADVSFGRLCGPMNLAGVPCLSLPCGLSESGSSELSVNLSITAGAGRDEVAIAFGAAFEDATGGAFRNRIAELRGAR